METIENFLESCPLARFDYLIAFLRFLLGDILLSLIHMDFFLEVSIS